MIKLNLVLLVKSMLKPMIKWVKPKMNVAQGFVGISDQNGHKAMLVNRLYRGTNTPLGSPGEQGDTGVSDAEGAKVIDG